jgi:subtilisin family serine protease
MQSLPEVLHVEPDYMVEALVTPNDNRWHLQWGLRAISAEKAWEVSTGSRDVTVCVIDSGVDFLHPELHNNMHPDLGYDIFTQKPLAESNDLNGHGTHVAGVVAAIGNNTSGISGLNWKASILGCKFLDADGVGYMSGILACIDYCVKANATISVNSYTLQGLNRRSSILKDAIEQAGTRDHLFVAAAGNAGQNNDLDVDPSFPAAFNLSNILSVAALEASSDASSPLKLAPYSNYGVYTTHIAAPGTNILSTWPNMALAYLTGTSMVRQIFYLNH